MFAQMFPCLPHLETLAFIAETKFASCATPHPPPPPSDAPVYYQAMQDMFGASSIHRLSIFYGYQSWIWTNFSIRSHHLFQPSVPTDEAGLHQ